MYLAKHNEVLRFMKKKRQIYDLNIFSQQTQKYKQKVKKEFGSSSYLQQQNLSQQPIKEPIVDF